MQDLPHRYAVEASAAASGDVTVRTAGAPDLATAPPVEFGGPGGRWTPEALLVGAVADCFVLTFRAIARASRIEWSALECEAAGTLDRADGQLRFTGFDVRAELTVPEGTDPAKAERALEKAERSCLVTRSLACECRLDAHVVTGATAT